MYKGIERTAEQDQEEAESSRHMGWLAGGEEQSNRKESKERKDCGQRAPD